MQHGGLRGEAQTRAGSAVRTAEDQQIGLAGVRDGFVRPLPEEQPAHERGRAASAHHLGSEREQFLATSDRFR